MVDCNGEENGVKILWCDDRVNDEGMKDEGSFEQTDTRWAWEIGQQVNG
jgi:hypothetical protein